MITVCFLTDSKTREAIITLHPQHHGQAPHQTPGIIPIMYNVKGGNMNQDFQQQSNVVMLPPSGPQQQYRFQAPPQPQPQFVYVQSPQQAPSTMPGMPIPPKIPAPQMPVSLNQQMTVPVTPSTSVEKDSLNTTPSTDSKSPVNMDSSKKKKKVNVKSVSNVDKDYENNEKTPEKQNSVKSKDNSESPLQLSCLKRMRLFI